MKFGPVPLDEAGGRVLAHNISDGEGRRVMRKGRALDRSALDTLRSLGLESVFVAELDPTDVHEDEAAARIAGAVIGPGVEAARPHTGRVNITARVPGVLRVDCPALDRVNQTAGVTMATLRTHTVVRPGDRIATVKIIPYGIPREAVEGAEASSGSTPAAWVDAIEPLEVAIVLVGGKGAWPRLEEGLGMAIRRRLEALGRPTGTSAFATPTEDGVGAALAQQMASGADLVVIAGETAVMDVNDLIPRGIVRAGGRVEHLGLAMDPGHLLLLGYVGDVPVVGAPGCVRGSSPDGFDAVLPRLLTGERLTRRDLQALGHGGLLSDPRKDG